MAYEHTYLMILFPRSLTGPALDWFTLFPKGIRSWDKLADKFVENYAYNIDIDVTIATLCKTTQEKYCETLIPFFQKWRGLAS